ncbi:MAG TPA: ATP-dependent zinc metalloprotease FtsH [Planctomycetes bacterium]|nr:ATP-dependent zinc metalloprotease FtsH [Planctomycetota bacterium]HIJ70984.1 ATP-dependent zinc metalloprotease FtsH [Planctomycetota bacterium]
MTDKPKQKRSFGQRPQIPPGSPKKPLPKYGRGPLSWLVIVLVAFSILMIVARLQSVEKIDYSPDFEDYRDKGYIASVELRQNKMVGRFTDEYMTQQGGRLVKAFEVNYDPDLLPQDFLARLRDKGVKVSWADQDIWLPLFLNILPFLLLVAIIYFVFIRNVRTGGGMLMSFGRSKHKLQGKGQKVTFNDVAGIEEAKEEVAETIEFLKNPKKFRKIGGRIPRGVLLVGPPGCGKTLLARAIAGESDVPFFSISGSDFVEMFVGVGASRVRDLFKQAKENAPCIIFLDEVDAIGRKRGPGFVSGGHDEREQTLNAILVEMDGFDTDDQVIVMAATNRSDILDHALTRPGRFDRQVIVPLPDLKGRLDILKIHAKKVKIGPDVQLERVARGTPMFSGAELEALINEAAISASMADKDYVEMPDLEEARDKVKWGRAKKSRVVDEQDKKLTAYHEAGHAFVQSMLEEADPLHKVSIIPRGPMGGATFALPEKDRMFYTKRYCIAQLQVCFAGRIAEQLFCDDITSGAQSDIIQATSMAKEMVLTWGMGREIGPINYGPNPVREMYYPSMTPDYSQKTAELIDKEVKSLIDEAYSNAFELIETNKEKIEAIAKALLKYETLDADDVKIILNGGTLDKPTVSDLLAIEQQRNVQPEKADKSPS